MKLIVLLSILVCSGWSYGMIPKTTGRMMAPVRIPSISSRISSSSRPLDNAIQPRCTMSSSHITCLLASKNLIITGPKGKAAVSPEEDIILTRQVILNHFESPISHPVQTSSLDSILSKLTYAFPLFVLSSAILGSLRPSTLLWVNRGNLISILLALVMMAMGMTLETKDFTTLFTPSSSSSTTTRQDTNNNTSSASWKIMIPVGVACQYGIMPLAAWLVGRTFLLSSYSSIASSTQDVALFLGLILVGSAPGGTASNLVSYIAGADVALSVLLTAISTVLASFITPLMVQILVGKTIQISGTALCIATAQVVLVPVFLGMILRSCLPKLAHIVSRFASFASVLFVSLICGGVVSNHADLILSTTTTRATTTITTTTTSSSSLLLLPKIISSVCILHTLGFIMGYIIPRHVLRLNEKTARTISIETGMQNSALAVVLAKSIGADPISCLPGAFSATMHSCLGSLLAVYWRYVDQKKRGKE